jgi:VanZ family protein
MLTIFGLSSMSGKQIEPWMLKVPQWDKVCHATAFATGAVILTIALRVSTALPMWKIVLTVIAVISFFGVTDEWHQKFTPGRSAMDVFDWLADTLGATLGAFATYVRQARFGKSKPASSESAPGN